MDYTLEKILRSVQKPARYTGGEVNSIVKKKEDVSLRIAFCFPDTYEIGMSHLGMKILYAIFNNVPGVWCERCFAPLPDMRDQLVSNGMKLFGLESRDPLDQFDAVAFTLQYEMSYTTILYMLELGGIPLLASERKEGDPFVFAGGPCTCNPEPLADFFDFFSLGAGEEISVEIAECLKKAKNRKASRKMTLYMLSRIKGVYVPSRYKVDYNEDGTVASVTGNGGKPAHVERRMLYDLDSAYYPTKVVVPLIEIVHDRATVEVLRGCIHGCRFCQAGFIYRPMRPRKADTINRQAKELIKNTGYSEISLSSLSTSDHPELGKLLDELISWTEPQKINLSLPSLRIDNFDDSIIEKTTRVRKSGLTFAVEAGTQRLRDVINKNVTEEQVMRTCRTAFSEGYSSVKLYFMIGHPTETDEDVKAIAGIAQRVVDLYYQNENRKKGRAVQVSCSVACFVPKPFTPFEFVPMDTLEEFERKQKLLLGSVTSRKINIKYHDARTSVIEALLARGDRRLGKVILDVYRDGGVFESWDEGFSYDRWMRALEKNGLDLGFYTSRKRSLDEVFPWDHIDCGISRQFLIREYKKALEGKTTPSCTEKCSGCGIAAKLGRPCFGD
ncbi:MAG: TIGR03960 family B12-binding radical SAM protein [Oscillospiraceae bacterium]|jgi:radical SAM family uncharacterized protein